jgi:Cu/Ag efflux pump CusA
MTGETRLGIFDFDGEGEVVGGIVVMRYGENADEVITGRKGENGQKLPRDFRKAS